MASTKSAPEYILHLKGMDRHNVRINSAVARSLLHNSGFASATVGEDLDNESLVLAGINIVALEKLVSVLDGKLLRDGKKSHRLVHGSDYTITVAVPEGCSTEELKAAKLATHQLERTVTDLTRQNEQALARIGELQVESGFYHDQAVELQNQIGANRIEIPQTQNPADGFTIAYLKTVVAPRIGELVTAFEKEVDANALRIDDVLAVLEHPTLEKNPSYLAKKKDFAKAKRIVEESKVDKFMAPSAESLKLVAEYDALARPYEGGAGDVVRKLADSITAQPFEVTVIRESTEAGAAAVSLYLPIAPKHATSRLADTFVKAFVSDVKDYLFEEVGWENVEFARYDRNGLVRYMLELPTDATEDELTFAHQDLTDAALDAKNIYSAFMPTRVHYAGDLKNARKRLKSKSLEEDVDETVAGAVLTAVAEGVLTDIVDAAKPAYTQSATSDVDAGIMKMRTQQMYRPISVQAAKLNMTTSALTALIKRGYIHADDISEGEIRARWVVSDEEMLWVMTKTPRHESGRYSWQDQADRPKGYVSPSPNMREPARG